MDIGHMSVSVVNFKAGVRLVSEVIAERIDLIEDCGQVCVVAGVCGYLLCHHEVFYQQRCSIVSLLLYSWILLFPLGHLSFFFFYFIFGLSGIVFFNGRLLQMFS